ncbi:MAG: PP2C family protein-serine/threonine phosphatase, partial [Actinomycetota bacterium]
RLYRDRSMVAATLQRSLLPPELPHVPGIDLGARYVAAGDGIEVGGDFYDVFQTGAKEWAIVMGDVCGKGVDAAALTGLARSTLRATAMQTRKPARILKSLNKVLMATEMGDRFCTLNYVRLRKLGDELLLTVCSAGHPLPMILTDLGEVHGVGEPGTLLGQFEDTTLSEQIIRLAPGDSLVLFTDGVIEARGTEGELEEGGLRELLRSLRGSSATKLATKIERKALDIQKGKPHDDIAVLVIKAQRLGAETDYLDQHDGPARSIDLTGPGQEVMSSQSAPQIVSFSLPVDEQAASNARHVLRAKLR